MIRCHRVTCYVDGEAVSEPQVPSMFIPLLRWLVRLMGGTIHVSEGTTT